MCNITSSKMSQVGKDLAYEEFERAINEIFSYCPVETAKRGWVTPHSFSWIMDISEEEAVEILEREGIPLSKPGWYEVVFNFKP